MSLTCAFGKPLLSSFTAARQTDIDYSLMDQFFANALNSYYEALNSGTANIHYSQLNHVKKGIHFPYNFSRNSRLCG